MGKVLDVGKGTFGLGVVGRHFAFESELVEYNLFDVSCDVMIDTGLQWTEIEILYQ